MKALSTILEKTIRVAIGVLLIVLSANVLLQILSRQVFRIQTVWTDEVARFTFIWMTMLGASLQVKYKSHYAVSLFENRVKRKTLLALFVYFSMLLLALAFVWYGVIYSKQGLRQYSTSAGILLVWVYAAIPVAGLLMMFFLVELIFGLYRRPEEESSAEKGGS